jgi:hypothetical protein
MSGASIPDYRYCMNYDQGSYHQDKNHPGQVGSPEKHPLCVRPTWNADQSRTDQHGRDGKTAYWVLGQPKRRMKWITSGGPIRAESLAAALGPLYDKPTFCQVGPNLETLCQGGPIV